MKSHAFLVGVNVAASIPLVLAPQAMASDNMSGTASFLKAAVGDKATARTLSSAPVLASKPLNIRRSLSSASLSEPQAINSRLAMTPVAGATKLRPFVAGRKLPSRSQLQTQMPQLDNSAQARTSGSLAGSINESTFAAQANNSYDSGYGNTAYTQSAQSVPVSTGRSRMRQAADIVAGFQRKHAARSMPGQSVSTPGQVGFPCAAQSVANVNQPARTQNAPSEAEWTQMARNAGNPQDDAEMASLAQDFAASQAQGQAQSAGSAGPAPFPLSLIPQSSLKQLIGSTGKASPAVASHGAGRPQQAMTPSYFGSWHQSQPVAHGRAGNLQPSGFHTYLAGGQGGSKTTTSSAFKSYSPMTYKATRRVAPKFIAAAKKAAPVAAAPYVATYGTYHSPAL